MKILKSIFNLLCFCFWEFWFNGKNRLTGADVEIFELLFSSQVEK